VKRKSEAKAVSEKKIRVLVGKVGLDGHDRGAKVIARAYRDAGMEVIYTGLHWTPEQVAEAAIQEGVDVVALSILSGAHNTLAPRVTNFLREKGCGDVVVLVGGIIPEDDVSFLKERGFSVEFGPSTETTEIVECTRKLVSK